MSDAPSSVPAPSPGSSKGPDPLIGRVVNDRYRITSLIARGGMGKVYRAEQAPLGREVALKVLNPNYQGDNDPEFHKRFFLEASICAKLTHPNTVTIFDYGRTDDDIYYIAMELLEGRTLHRALRDETVLPPQRALHIARQVCRSLREAHSMGVIHRDLKPANIYLVRHGDENDFAKVLDFGLVKDIGEGGEELTQTGLFMGSPKYMSPEQIRGEKVDGRCDIYALGVIMYEMLTGKVPFDRPNSVNILMAHVHEAVPAMTALNPDLQISPALEEVVMRAMAKKPEDRYASMDEFLVALKQASDATGLAYSRSGEMTTSGEFGGRTGTYPVSVTGEPISGGNFTPSGGSLITSSHTGVSSWESPLGPSSQETSKGRGKLVAAAVVLLAVGIGGALALHDSPEAPPPVAAPTNEAPPAPVAEAPVPEETAAATATPTEPEAPVEAIRRIRVMLRSTPPGASVVVGAHTYGPTPAEIEWTGDDAREGREVTFQFQLEDHRDYTVTRTLYGDTLSVEAALERIEEAPRRTRVRRVVRSSGSDSNQGSTSPNVRLKGYKLEPY
jgi:serine/threonine-protein kinase